MPATSDKQAIAARIALAVKKGKATAKPGSASAQMAKGMSKNTIKHFTHTEETLKLKEFIKEFLIKEKVKQSIRGIIQEVLNEEKESPIVRNIKSVENFDELLAKPENAGQPFTKEEIDAIQRLDVKPTKLTNTEINFGAPEEMSGKNKDLVIRKVTGKYVGFFSLREPVDVSPDKGLTEADEPQTDEPAPESTDDPLAPQKDEVFIIVSRPLTNSMQDITLLSNFITHLVNEYQIS